MSLSIPFFSFLYCFCFFCLSAPTFLAVKLSPFLIFLAYRSTFVSLLSVLLSPAVKDYVRTDHFLSSNPVIGCCFILGEVNNCCCCVESRETQWEVLIGALGEAGGRFGLLAQQVLMVSLPYNPLHPWHS